MKKVASQNVERRVKCKECGRDIRVYYFAGAVGGDFYCRALPCLIAMSRRIEQLTATGGEGDK